MQKIREIQHAVFEKMRKTFNFWNFLPFWLKFWTDAAQNVQFSSFPEKTKTSLFYRVSFAQSKLNPPWELEP